MSRGAFTVRGDVFPWVRTSSTLAHVVGSEKGLGQDANLGDYDVGDLRTRLRESR